MPSSLNGGGSRSSSSSTAMGVPPRADAISVPAMGSSVDMRGSGRGEVGRPRTGQSHILGEAKRSRVERGRAAALGGAITREAGPVKGGNTIIAFITDPDGYKIEFIQKG